MQEVQLHLRRENIAFPYRYFSHSPGFVDRPSAVVANAFDHLLGRGARARLADVAVRDVADQCGWRAPNKDKLLPGNCHGT
jgi:hypothetical protein